jgi:hypothetical protein
LDPAEIAQMMDEAKALITFMMVSTAGIGTHSPRSPVPHANNLRLIGIIIFVLHIKALNSV